LKRLKVRGASEHQSQEHNLDIPLSILVCVTGVVFGQIDSDSRLHLRGPEEASRGDGRVHVGAFQSWRERSTSTSDSWSSIQCRTPDRIRLPTSKVYDAIRETIREHREAQSRGFDPRTFHSMFRAGAATLCQGDGSGHGRDATFPIADVEPSARMQRHALQAAGPRRALSRQDIHDVLTDCARSDHVLPDINRYQSFARLDEVGLG